MSAEKAREPVADRLAALLDGPGPIPPERAIAAIEAAAPESPVPPRALVTMAEIVFHLARLGAAARGPDPGQDETRADSTRVAAKKEPIR